MTAAASAFLPAPLAVRVFLVFAGAYFLSFARRSVNAIIAPDLIAEFGLTNAQLGALSSTYFVTFAAMQIPAGVWLDRYGSRRVDGTLLIVAAAGCAVFALARDVNALWIGRALIGIGVSCALMAALRAYRFWYAPARQQQLVAWMLVAGTLGALVTTVPVQAVLPHIGWRGVFWVTAALLCLASAAVFLQLPGEPAHAAHDDDAPWSAYLQVYGNPYFWRFGIVSLTVQSSFVAFQGLWIGPWMRRVLGMEADSAAQVLFVFNLVLMLGYLALGWAVPWLARNGLTTLRLVVASTVLMLGLEVAIAFAGGSGAWLLWLALALAATGQSLSQTHVSLSLPEPLTGRAFTAYNLLSMAGMFLAQWLFGATVDALSNTGGHDAEAFRRAMLVWVAIQFGALMVLLFWRVQPRKAAA
ncbi:MAG: MFS transporter [Burkholderiaceae bacterium]|nr:MFS transporter [Burkholderiaceae bacterium]